MRAAQYIDQVLDNPTAAQKLVDDTEKAILERLNFAESFEPYPSTKQREYPYYRIYVHNCTVFYVVIDGVMEVLREAMAMGADNGILVTDRVLGGADTWATSQTIAGALRNLDYDLIITGRQAIDGDTAQVGPQISEHLGLPVISYAQKIREVNEAEKYIVVERQYDDRYHVVKAQLPCLLTALAELNEPRYMTPGGIFDAYDAEITTWGRKDLKDVDDSNLGLAGSPTQIAKASDKVRKGKGVMMTAETAEEGVEYIMDKLLTKHVI